MASNRLHAEPVNGRTTAVGPERARSDPALIPGQVEQADNFVDLEDSAQWIDCFRLNGNTYEVNVCECLLPTIVCRTLGEDEPHSKAPSKTTNAMIEALKTEMGTDNYRIINELRKKEDQRITAQAATARAAAGPSSGKTAAGGRHRKQHARQGQPLISQPSPGAYDDEDGYYDED